MAPPRSTNPPKRCGEFVGRIRDILCGDQIVVRGEASGTPTGTFWGAKPTGKGFRTMSMDLLTVKNGKLASAYHVENWITALRRIE